MGVHRVAYYLTHGQWPLGQVDHECHNLDLTCTLTDECPHRLCCNPAHLSDKTASENQRAKRTRCRNGHPWHEEGTDYEVTRSDGRWRCLHCRRAARAKGPVTPWKARKSVCKRGHDLTDPANVYLTPTGTRVCRPCKRIRAGARSSPA